MSQLVSAIDIRPHLLDDSFIYDRMLKAVNPYGDGMAAKRIGDVLKDKMIR